MMNRGAYVAAVLIVAAIALAALRFFSGESGIDTDRPFDDDRREVAERPREGWDRGAGGSEVDRRRPQGGDRGARRELRPDTTGGIAGRGGSRPGVRDSGSDAVIGGIRSGRGATLGRSASQRDSRNLERSARAIETDPQEASAAADRETTDRLDGMASTASPSGSATTDSEGDVVDAAQEEEEGTLFDPLAPEVQSGEVDRGTDEDPLRVSKVDFLEDGSIYVDNDSVYTFPAAENIKSEEGTIDMVIVPEWDGGDGTDHSLLHVGSPGEWKNRMRIVKNGESIRFMTFDNEGIERSINVRIPQWAAGERHEITASWDAEGIRLFLDGELAGERPLDGRFVFNEKALIELGTPGGTDGPAATYEDLIVSSQPEYAVEY